MKIARHLFFAIYHLFVMPIVVALALSVGLLHRKVRTGLRDRLNLRKMRRRFENRPIWIHASSGEFEYAKSVIRGIKTSNPEIPILVTYFSPSYAKQISSFQGVDQAEPLPLDLPGPVSDFLRFYKPRLALFARTDLWPEILRQTHQRRIPSLLFSCTRPHFSGLKRLSGVFYSLFYSMLDHIQCVSLADQNNLRRLTKTPVVVTGDTRYDQVAFRLAQGRDLSSILMSTTLSRIIAGSTWPQDEAVLLSAIAPLIRAQKAQFILVPHEIDTNHIESLKNSLKNLNLNFSLFSENKSWSGSDVLIVDQLGVLADLYAYADFAFIGGSFKNKVHSVMEALGAGLPVIVGPYYKNNREATEFRNIQVGDGDLSALSAVQVANDEKQMRLILETLVGIAPAGRRKIKQQIVQEFRLRQGATEKVLTWVNEYLTNSSLQ